MNIDHNICNRAVITACRPEPFTSVDTIYGFEVQSSTEWSFNSKEVFFPQHFEDITDTLDRKLEILELYSDEMRDFPHPRSVEAVRALAMYRGASIGFYAAEAFSVIRSRHI